MRPEFKCHKYRVELLKKTTTPHTMIKNSQGVIVYSPFMEEAVAWVLEVFGSSDLDFHKVEILGQLNVWTDVTWEYNNGVQPKGD